MPALEVENRLCSQRRRRIQDCRLGIQRRSGSQESDTAAGHQEVVERTVLGRPVMVTSAEIRCRNCRAFFHAKLTNAPDKLEVPASIPDRIYVGERIVRPATT